MCLYLTKRIINFAEAGDILRFIPIIRSMIMNNKRPVASVSNKIDFLRFPLCIGVMMIHCSISGHTDSENLPGFTEAIVKLGSNSLPMLCVPMFFIISGYLGSFKTVDLHNYIDFLRKKCTTLVIPFIAWNIIAFLVRFLVQISPLGKFCSSPYVFDDIPALIVRIFIEPELIPLWFIRNLILFNIIFPVLLAALRKYTLISLLLSLIINDIWTPIGGIFYFCLGMAMGLKEGSGHFKINRKSAVTGFVLYLFAALLLALPGFSIPDNSLITIPVILIGCASVFALAPSERPRVDNSLLSPSGIFFLYAFHGIISPYIIKIVLLLLPLSIGGGIAAYTVCCLSVIGLSILSWYILSALFPKIMYFITGKRKISAAGPL